MFRRRSLAEPLPGLAARFGIRGARQVVTDLAKVARHAPRGDRYTFDLRSAGLLRPDLSLPAYAGFLPGDGISPIFNFFDRVGGGRDFRYTVRRSAMRDWRGGWLSYEEHDGTDFVCPPGIPLVAAAPGVVVASRDTWLRGGLTLCVDHGEGVVTQYTHLTSVSAELGARVARGEPIACSGTSGFDMTQFFPWVPPHVHFMVWVNGRPVDPFRAPGEATRPGTWLHGNVPQAAAGPLSDDPSPSTIRIRFDAKVLDGLVRGCADEAIRAELEHAPSDEARLALVEDSLHHDRSGWSDGARAAVLRPPGAPERVALTLPLPAELYRGALASDTPWTRPER